ncbi:cob(I)yrinic acid a,c-diamide adenosyltransferase [Parvibaculum sp.]|uniref:cob(I)yrinic acid a,c-diamide adenosyltransferase n=1 Tax=Parvibaculum sp. TaxID=2024848 RepID=UPI0027170AF0|nr:cob(I)yrinic acid a,c-diamide adenosyltransferase [Parvibaculum sp.]MDO9125790.1 cob(I)yrinic acid a,c-diamide adenosyltransferase [Parvibaculum sp.]MDP1625751.1 cob(I)yrinic acid a,c-diamide adenosyltransferase [Parvibaculum sp.]MDP2149114.1 cob(I)yrinic acid a,c-diamide adenosyltransferase [Parvibaculum sp.]MDP3328347.1 cob(I)yrinic acid a,c-diamide adenosyltransferase [Parvibaculum sp.]
MVTLNKIYTRTGDKGTTALANGERVPKHALRIESYGTVDETNSVIGIARLHTGGMARLDAMLMRIQNDLFDLGADLATPDRGEKLGYEPLRILDAQVDRLEKEIDELNGVLEPLRSFVLPGGTAAAAHLHLARTVCRRAERLVTALMEEPEEKVSEAALRYLNRLSDFLFVAARYVNRGEDGKGPGDVLWVPGGSR